jgi:hypothetical protein
MSKFFIRTAGALVYVILDCVKNLDSVPAFTVNYMDSNSRVYMEFTFTNI